MDHHALLANQLRHLQLSEDTLPDEHTWRRFLATVNQAYQALPAPIHLALNTPLELRLAAIAGFDLQWAREIVGGRLELLAQLLEMFVEGHADDPERIRKLAKQADWQGLQRLAHTIKGAAGSIGGEEVARLAGDLRGDESPTQATMAHGAELLAIELEQFVDSIRGALDTA